MAAIKGRLAGYTAGDTDLAWSRITYWRALLTAALDQPPYEPITSAVVSGLRDEPALDVLAGWLASRIDGPVQREVGELKVELIRSYRDHHAAQAADRCDRDDHPHRQTGLADPVGAPRGQGMPRRGPAQA